MDVNMLYTIKGQILRAKMETGVSLNITRIVAGTGRSGDLENLKEIVDIRQELTITGKQQRGTQSMIFAVLSNKGLQKGYDLTQLGIMADDPDEGEILYRVAELKYAFPISSEKDFPNFSIDCNFTDTISNASEVNIIVNPSGMVTVKMLEEKLDALKNDILSFSSGGIVFSPTRPEGDWKLWIQDLGEAPDIPFDDDETVTLIAAPYTYPGEFAVGCEDGNAETIVNMTDNPQTANDDDIIIAEE